MYSLIDHFRITEKFEIRKKSLTEKIHQQRGILDIKKALNDDLYQVEHNLLRMTEFLEHKSKIMYHKLQVQFDNISKIAINGN